MRHREILLASALILATALPLTAQVTGLSGWDIYLDPGHSQTENVGVFGYSEAQKNVRVGLALRELLLEKTDIDTVYISRTNDTDKVSLAQRSDHANALGASWFHSIHSDAGSSSSNSTLFLWGQYADGREKDPPGGQALSDQMSPLLTRGMRTDARGSIGDCSFYMSFIDGACSGGGPYLSVNRRTTMPSELSEAGFHTNPTQNQRNMNADWTRLEAWTFFWAILAHHGIERPPVSNLTGIITDAETGKAINGAEITILDQVYTTDTYELVFSDYSDDPNELSNGVYFFEDLEIGPGKTAATVTVNADGYHSFISEVTLVDTFFTFVDAALIPSTPPRVSDSAPDSGGVVRVVDPISLVFSRPMDRPTTEAAFDFEPSLTGVFTWPSDFTVSFRPDSVRPNSAYTLTVAETALGKLGDPIDGDGDGAPGGNFVLPFETGFPDITQPQVVGSEPRQRATGIDRLPVTSLTFNEQLDSTSMSEDKISLTSAATGAPVDGTFEHYVEGQRSIPTFFPTSVLDPEAQYLLRLEAGVTDLFGNPITSPRELFFTTASRGFDRTDIDSFNGGVNDWWTPQQSNTTGIVTELTDRSSDSVRVNHLTASEGSMRIDYGWDTGASNWLIRVFLSGGAAKEVEFDSTFAVEAMVFGDGSGTEFRFAVDDKVPVAAGGNHEVSPWTKVNWYGWKKVSWLSSRDGVGDWLGDGSLDGTLRFDSIQLRYQPGAAESGTIYVDDLRLAKRSPEPVSIDSDELPKELQLDQNYPNPFNPATRIRFNLPERASVSLKVYAVTGAEIETLLDGSVLGAGSHDVVWNAAARNLPSGVFIARLEANGVSRVIRMVLLK